MDVDRGRSNRFMSKQGFDGKQIRAILIEVGTESVPEGMAGDPVFPSQPFFMQSDMMWDMLMVEGPGCIPLLCEQPVPWASPGREGIPVFQDGIPCGIRKDGISGGTVFGLPYKDTLVGMLNIRAF